MSALTRVNSSRKSESKAVPKGREESGRGRSLLGLFTGAISQRGRARAGAPRSREAAHPRYEVRLELGVADARVSVHHRGAPRHTDARRGPITEWSRRSRRRAVYVLRNARVPFVALITLTYPREYPTDGRVVKRHLNRFLTALRRLCPGAQYFWIEEFQGRGAPHIHMALSCRVPRRWLSETWYRVVGSGDERHLRAGTNVVGIYDHEGIVRYLAKYLMKGQQKRVPEGFEHVGRFWGASRGLAAPRAVLTMAVPDLRSAGRLLRRLRAWREHALARMGIRWRPRAGRGFVLWDGAAVAPTLWTEALVLWRPPPPAFSPWPAGGRRVVR